VPLIGDFEEPSEATALVKSALHVAEQLRLQEIHGIDPVFTGTKALSARVDAEWMAWR